MDVWLRLILFQDALSKIMSPTSAIASTLVGGVRILPLWKTKKLALYLVSQVIPCDIGLTINRKKDAGSNPPAPEEMLFKIGCLEMGNVEEEKVIFFHKPYS